jgi:hypothetical protein
MAVELKNAAFDLMAAESPICEFGFLAARARSIENAAIAKSSAPPRGRKTGHSCKAQQDKSVELTDSADKDETALAVLGLLACVAHRLDRGDFVN